MRIAFVPIDNRPVCYTLAKCIANIDESLEFHIPERSLLGDLTKQADVEGLFNWLTELPQLDAIVLSLDTLAYGGLIPSRRCSDSFEQIKDRIFKLKMILEQKQCKVFAFSSIMRISNNNINQEEKEYWSDWGEKIFKYSYNSHKLGNVEDCDVPQDILADYLATRRRNFEINKLYLNWQKEGLFEVLVFSKDDCAEFGLNVFEAQQLEALGGVTKTGADEIPLSLLARAIPKSLKICPVFLEPDSVHLISNYEDVSIENSVKGQIQLAGCEISAYDNADILLYVNNFRKHQGEIVMKVDTEMFCKEFVVPNRPYMIADVRFANGSDNSFITEFFKNKIEENNFYGYSAWNTSANSLGSLICAAKIKYFTQKYSKENFDKLQITRFLDDWAYQANVRQELDRPDLDDLKIKMQKFESVVENFLGTKVNVNYLYPWNRLFEVEIEFN
ncbi:MAG: DUF4127 family protein [Cyanobacteria bacterium SIG26]|nr:DUF4127 family protein [Cyanobacteria bacterium SIG26]